MKPKLLFFQARYDETVPAFLTYHRKEHVRCLSQWFKVVEVASDCDYAQVCDEHEPDLSLFECGNEILGSRRLRISNVVDNASVPKVAFLNADGCSENRSGILSDLDEWRIETCFTISVCAADHLPELRDRLFVWPNFIDPEIFRDYGKEQVVPILLTGSTSARYPWRRKIFPKLMARYPTLRCPHGGYTNTAVSGRMLHGRPYAELINASQLAPTCGSVTNEVVRKHFEIPGARSCLVTARSEALEAAGFQDMENCIFADEENLGDKLDFVLGDPNERARIANAGFELVHKNHTMRNRDQLYSWFLLNKGISPGERIIQDGPFGHLQAIGEGTEGRTRHITSGSAHLNCISVAESALSRGDYRSATSAYLECLAYLPEFPEAKLGLTICSLYRGRPVDALGYVIQTNRNILTRYSAPDPDPVEWAYLIRSLVCRARAARIEEMSSISFS